MLLPLVLVFSVIGRGHAFQAVGLEIACAHPGEAEEESSPRGTPGDAPDKHSHHCPSDCSRCPCGQIPVVTPDYVPEVVAILEYLELPDSALFSERASLCDVPRLDRPPRHARA